MSGPKNRSESTGSLLQAAGVGIWIGQLFDEEARQHRGAIVVLEILLGSAAERGGLQRGDRITHVGNIPVAGMTLEEIVIEHLRGPIDSEVKLQVLRGMSSSGMDVRLVREMPASNGNR